MTLKHQIDEVLYLTGRPISVDSIAGALREMFAERVDTRRLLGELNDPSSHFVRVGCWQYGYHRERRAAWLAAELFGKDCPQNCPHQG